METGPDFRQLRACVGLALAALLMCACTSPLRVVARDAAARPPEGTGLLAIHAVSESDFKRVVIRSRSEWNPQDHALELKPGASLQMLVAPAGRYRWLRAEIASENFGVFRYDFPEAEEYDFEVQAGVVNFPGSLVFKRHGSGLIFRIQNRSTSVLTQLWRRYPKLLTTVPARYSGLLRDDFMAEFDARVRAQEQIPQRSPAAVEFDELLSAIWTHSARGR